MDFYDFLASKDHTRIADVISIFCTKLMEHKSWATFDTLEATRANIREMLTNRIKHAVEVKKMPGKIVYTLSSRWCDEHGAPLEIVDVENSYVSTTNFIQWAITEGLLPSAQDRQVLLTTETEYGPEETRYPDYRDLKFDDLDKKHFDNLKRDYGMLRKDEHKWRTAVSIAARIGLLFYERDLEKRPPRREFLKQYKEEFSSQLQNDTVANLIYDNLPEEYRGRTGAPKVKQDLDDAISAAVFAGYKEGTEGEFTRKDLTTSLREEGYEAPDEEVLEKIMRAVKKLRQ